MTTQEIFDTLQTTLDKLDDAGIDDSSKRNLHILVLQLQNELITESFNSLKDIDSVTVADTSQLPVLAAGVQTAIDDEKARTALVEKLIATAKVGLKAAGIPIP